MTSIFETIRALPLFHGLAEDQFRSLAGLAREKRYQKDNFIFHEGDLADGFYIVHTGRVKIFKMSLEGKQQILHLYGPGQPFGEVPVFSGKQFPANALAIEEARALFFPRRDFIDLIAANPSLALNMLAELSLRLREFTVMVENLALKEVPARMAGYFLRLSREQGAARVIQLPITKGQLADIVGTTPETISRVFNKMAADQLVQVNQRQITLLDPEGLADLAETS